jgi:hypothetical protein
MAHRILLAAAAALAVFTVSGCDINTGAQKPAQSTCNCAGTPPQASVPPAPSEPYTPPEYHRRHHTHGWHDAYSGHDGGAHSYYWRRSYSEIAVQTYDYRSSSSSYVIGEDGDRHDHGGYDHHGYRHGEGYAGGAVHGEGGWVDGYGRHHDGGEASVGEPAHEETNGDGARLHPWHGYDADCPDDRDPHHRN